MPESDAALATRLARETGELLVELRSRLMDQGSHPIDIMDAGDQASHRFISRELARHRPDDAVLGEEGHDDPRRFDRDRVWIVDPLDGSRQYGEPGRTDWAVHIALWGGDRFVAGAVALPASGLVMSTDPPCVVPPAARAQPRLATSRGRVPYGAVVVAERLGCDAIRLGSAGAKAMLVVNGLADIYVHDSGMYQWDSAAPAAVAAAAGLHVSRVDGTPARYNQPDTWMPDILICRPELADRVLRVLALR